MIIQHALSVGPFARGYHLITRDILSALGELPEQGVLHLFVQHTSAGLTINENADPDVRVDFETFFNRIAPEHLPGIVHTIEGPDDMPAHIKASLVGSSVSIPITEHRLNLGTWQGIYFCEFRDRGGVRRLVATIYS
ncbi:MAG: secondary thiamine-phosphate synthase enzyme YjbQ [Saprospiraceae bacterium]|nr:secondary thiamine-phosphate synthase enzyme YjbQ [Saprospiraceae bacterium]